MLTRNQLWLSLVACVGLAVAILSAVVLGCGHGATACAVVDVAHTACDVLPIRYLDDQGEERTELVPREELRAAAMRAGEVRAVDAGADQ